MKKSLLLFLWLLAGATFLSAQTSRTGAGNDIPYQLADRYFVSNAVFPEPLKAIKLETRAEFDSVFGMAPLSGALPTVIDFSRQYVIFVVAPTSYKKTELKALGLKKSGKNLLLTYSYSQGETLTYSTRHVIILIVDKKYKGIVKAVRSS